MKFSLVFRDWLDATGASVYNNPPDDHFLLSNLHAGTTFEAYVLFDIEDIETMELASICKITPIFSLHRVKGDDNE